ncbi:decaprenyl-phosphate phosphoribosyltransferase [candidate division KSB1 bacterium]|nr:decaprenyl-phosphate phosphoribosyltransferase [candidate division KSB1 bacterium]
MLKHLFQSLRPKQWTKNVIVFAGLFFAEDIFVVEKIFLAVVAFIAFSLVSSSGYLINDVVDRERDAQHPKKKHRPVAAGKISPTIAVFTAVILLIATFGGSFAISRPFTLILATYLVLTFGYSFGLKHVIILDVLIIASGFMLRAIGGTIIISEKLSSWLIICTTFLALFLAINKRRSEFIALGQNAQKTRKTLKKYSIELLNQMINTVTSACLISYALYTLDDQTVDKFDTRYLILTLPFVIYGLFRYLYIVDHKDIGETPELAILGDKPLVLCVMLFVITGALVIYF